MSQNRNKKILIATGIYPPDIGGPATYSKLLHDELPKRGFIADVLSFGEVRSWPKIIKHLIYMGKVIKHCRLADIIYVQDPVSVGLPVCLAGWLMRRKFILKIVGDYAWEQGSQRFNVKDFLDDFSSEYKKYSWPVRLLKLIQKKVADRAEKIIVPSEYLKKIVSNWGVNPDKIKVIYNAFDEPANLADKEKLRQELKFVGPVIISAGRLVPWKGFPVLIEVINGLKNNYPSLELLIIGEGPEKDNLEKKINTLNLSGRVKLLGRLSREELLKKVKAADIFILNTSYEGFSHQLLEVMWCGTPIITTNVGGNPELITNGENGYLVNYNDYEKIKEKIEKLLGDKEFSDSLAEQARKRVTSFTKERMISELIKELS